MYKGNIIKVLESRDYDSRSANLVAPELLSLSSPLKGLFNKWLDDSSINQDYSCHGYSIVELMKERNMSYPAALLTIDWLIKEPNMAIKSLRRGIK